MKTSIKNCQKNVEFNFYNKDFIIKYELDSNANPVILSVQYAIDKTYCHLWKQNQEFINSFLSMFYNGEAVLTKT